MNKNDNVTKHETEIGALLEQIKQLEEAIESICPFCKEDDFDLIGLKYHIEYGCEKYHTFRLEAK